MKTESQAMKEIQAILDEEFTGYVDQLHSKLARIQSVLYDVQFPGSELKKSETPTPA